MLANVYCSISNVCIVYVCFLCLYLYVRSDSLDLMMELYSFCINQISLCLVLRHWSIHHLWLSCIAIWHTRYCGTGCCLDTPLYAQDMQIQKRKTQKILIFGSVCTTLLLNIHAKKYRISYLNAWLYHTICC